MSITTEIKDYEGLKKKAIEKFYELAQHPEKWRMISGTGMLSCGMFAVNNPGLMVRGKIVNLRIQKIVTAKEYGALSREERNRGIYQHTHYDALGNAEYTGHIINLLNDNTDAKAMELAERLHVQWIAAEDIRTKNADYDRLAEALKDNGFDLEERQLQQEPSPASSKRRTRKSSSEGST